MANETIYSGFVTLAAYIDAGIIPVLRDTSVMLNLMYPVNFESGSNSKKLRSRVAQTAAVVAEAAEATSAVFSNAAGNTLLAKKVVVLNELTEEAELFAGVQVAEVIQEQGLAIADKVDTDALALFSGFSNTAGTTGTRITPTNLVEAAYKVRLAKVPGSLVYVLHPTHVLHIQKDIITAGASVWANPSMINLLASNQPKANQFRGSYMGIDIFDSVNVGTINSAADYCSACLNPSWALAFGTVRPPDTIIEGNSSKRTREVNTDYYYDAKERLDGAGCGVVGQVGA